MTEMDWVAAIAGLIGYVAGVISCQMDERGGP